MTLRIMEPIAVLPANITASNVALETAWTAGTYTLGTQRRVDDRLYEVSAASTTQEPTPTATEWFDAGPANRFAAFDLQFGADKFRVVETVTTNAESITFTLEALTQISGIAFFGLRAQSVRIIGTLTTTGDVADIDRDLQDGTNYNGSFWRWAFLPQTLGRKYINLDLNIPLGATLEIEVNNPSSTAEVGTIALGNVLEYGIVETDADRSLKSRSIKKTEGTRTSLLRRTPSSKVRYPITLQNGIAQQFWDTISDLDGVGAVFAGPDNAPELSVYGFITSAQTTAKALGRSKVSMEVETL